MIKELDLSSETKLLLEQSPIKEKVRRYVPATVGGFPVCFSELYGSVMVSESDKNGKPLKTSGN